MKGRRSAGHSTKSRRRVLRLLAAPAMLGVGGALGMLSGRLSAPEAFRYHWRGLALGANASLTIYHPDAVEAARLTRAARAEIERLENIYSLYRHGSAIARLNRDGRLDNPPPELAALLSRARWWSEATGGAFDVTVQPLWKLFRDHFSNPAADPDGPPQAVVAQARRLVDYRALEIGPGRVALGRPGMAVTLNGIAQGDITDRVTELLRAEGLTQSLIQLGEVRALGSHPKGRPWRVGIKDPRDNSSLVAEADLVDRAIATSSVTGTVFGSAGRLHHLFDPRSGWPSRGLVSASVIAKQAADADALSTALVTASQQLTLEPYADRGIEWVLTTHGDGSRETWNAYT